MNKRVFFGLLSAMVILSGCSDDSVPGVQSKQPCTTEGATSCSAIGELLVCQNGFFEPQSCGENMRCRSDNGIAACAETCVPEHFAVTCGGEEGIRTCSSEGFVVLEPCEKGNICYDTMCIDESRTTCDSSYPIHCRDDKTVTQCKRGWVVSHPCAEDQICQNGICVKAETCDSSIYATVCADDNTIQTCQNGFVTSIKCGDGKLCHNGACTDDCEEGYAACSSSGASSYVCENGKIKEVPCNSGTCTNGKCNDQQCSPGSYTPVCVDGKVQKCSLDGQIITESCTAPLECYEGACVSDAPCNEKTFTPVCVTDGSLQVCTDGYKTVNPCPQGETCEGGICQALDEPCDEEGAVACESAGTVKTCKDGVWHESLCAVGSEVCIAGICTDKSTVTTCSQSTYVPKCDVNATLTCEFGYVTKRECDTDQHCDAGVCYDNLTENAPCDAETFVQQCFDDGFVAICQNGVVTKVSCGDQRCEAGACVPKTCDPATFAPECRDTFEVTACIDSTVTKVNCDPNTHCENGVCIPDAKPGDPCNPETFAATCNADGKRLTCETDSGVSTIVATECTGDNAVCLNGACVACDPNTFTQTCTPATSSNSGPLKTSCNPDGSWKHELCAIDMVCFGADCAQCDPATSKPSCLNATTSQICKADGTFESKVCAAGEQCVDGTGCTKACDADGKCAAEHYVCVAGTCIFQPECTTSAVPECHDANSYKVCEAPGIYSTPTNCQSNEKCENGVCIGNECDSSTYGTKCDGNTPTVCVNGYIVENAVCSGNTPYCINGTCKACKHGETAVQCSGSGTAVICAPDHTLTTETCDGNEICKPGEGCISKCTDFTGDYCDANGNRVYCADSGNTATETCEFTETCIDGTCTDRTGNYCTRDFYTNKCHDTAHGSVLEYCHTDPSLGVQFKTCTTTGSSGNFCGTINGETDCFRSCTTPSTDPTCTYFNQDLYEGYSLGLCTAGVNHLGNQAYGYMPRLGVCREYGDSNILYSSSCYVNGSSLEFKTFVCESMGRGTCDSNSGACTGAVECTTADTKCDGMTAKSCEYDPALQKNVLLSMDCSTLGDKTCVTYTVKGEKRAVCKGTQTYDNVTPAYSVSSLGTCNADGKNPNVLHTLHYLSSNHFGFYSTTCASGCETVTNNGVTYAYCK